MVEHECVFPEEQEPLGRLILCPCLVCNRPAMGALEEAKRWQVLLAEAEQRLNQILNVIYTTHGYLVDGEIDTAAKFRAIERLARLDWDDEGMPR